MNRRCYISSIGRAQRRLARPGIGQRRRRLWHRRLAAPAYTRRSYGCGRTWRPKMTTVVAIMAGLLAHPLEHWHRLRSHAPHRRADGGGICSAPTRPCAIRPGGRACCRPRCDRQKLMTDHEMMGSGTMIYPAQVRIRKPLGETIQKLPDHNKCAIFWAPPRVEISRSPLWNVA
jgi:hypothetical protein